VNDDRRAGHGLPNRRTKVKRITILSVLLSLLIALPVLAQPRGSADVVKAAPVQSSVTATAGERVEFAVKLDIQHRWHLYAHGDTTFIGVDLVPDETFPLQEFGAVYPEGHEGEFFGEKVRMIEGRNTIEASALVPAGMPAGEHPLELSVTVQACDDKTCLAPAHLPIKLTLKVE